MNDFEGQLHPEETDDYLQYCEEEEYYADLEQIQQENALWPWLEDNSMADNNFEGDY